MSGDPNGSEDLAGRLREYLVAHLPAVEDVQVQGVQPIPGGLSQQMYFFQATWRESDREIRGEYVLRRDPPPGEGVLETDRLTEAAVLRAVRAGGLPVPEVPWADRDPAWLGRPFLIMERVPGTMIRDVPATEAGSERFRAIGRRLAAVLGRLHALDPAEIAARTGLPLPKPGHAAAEEQLARHESVLARDALEPQPVLTDVLLWLRRRMPATERPALVHADYRLSNLLLSDDEITGVLDWELAHLGDPHEDLGRLISRDRDLVSGLLPRAEFIAVYEEHSGIKVDLEACYFWEVMARLRATITMLTGVRAYTTSGYRHLHLGFMGLSHANRLYDLLHLIDG